MLGLLLTFSNSIKSLTISANSYQVINCDPSDILVPVNPGDFKGYYIDKSGGKHYDLFSSGDYYILNFSISYRIYVENPSSYSRTFYYQTFSRMNCEATEIWINPPNNHGYVISSTRNDDDDNNIKMRSSQTLCFLYVWDPKYDYSISIYNNGLELSDKIGYNTDGSNYFTDVTSYTSVGSGINSLAIKFRTDSSIERGSANFRFSTSNSISGTLHPDPEKALCMTNSGHCYWKTLEKYVDSFNDHGLSAGAIVGIVFGVIFFIVIVITLSFLCCCGTMWFQMNFCCYCCCPDKHPTGAPAPSTQTVQTNVTVYGQPQYPQQQPQYPQYAQPQYPPQQPQYPPQQYAQPQYAPPQYAQPQYGQPTYGQPQYPQYSQPNPQPAAVPQYPDMKTPYADPNDDNPYVK